MTRYIENAGHWMDNSVTSTGVTTTGGTFLRASNAPVGAMTYSSADLGLGQIHGGAGDPA